MPTLRLINTNWSLLGLDDVQTPGEQLETIDRMEAEQLLLLPLSTAVQQLKF